MTTRSRESGSSRDGTPPVRARDDGSYELSQRALFTLLFTDPAVRNYLIAGLSALAMIFLVLFQQASDLGGLLIVVIGAAGLMLRWTAAPAFVLFVLTYFMVFPFGVPSDAFENRWEIEDGFFRPTDLILTMAVLVYMACQFRILGFVHQAIAPHGAIRRHDELPARRPPAVIAASELPVLMCLAFVLVMCGQLVWWVVNSLEVVPTEDFPLRWVPSDPRYRRSIEAGGLPLGLTRFVVMVGLAAIVLLLGRLVFGYWRLRMLEPIEGAMILLDDGWLETKRERSRQEKWRIWGRNRTEDAAMAADAAKTGDAR
jgi:hypothetical protein